jgi:hypothetical protein
MTSFLLDVVNSHHVLSSLEIPIFTNVCWHCIVDGGPTPYDGGGGGDLAGLPLSQQ